HRLLSAVTLPPDTHTLSLHDALPISSIAQFGLALFIGLFISLVFFAATCSLLYFRLFTEIDEDRLYYTRLRQLGLTPGELQRLRSEEHTSELQSRENLVCRLLLETKK